MRIIQRFFGETEQEQYLYLKKWFTVSAVILLVGLVLEIFYSGAFAGGIALMFLVWGIRTVKVLYMIFGVYHDTIIAAAILFLYILIGYFVGICIFFVGLIRFIQLWMRRKQLQ